MKHSGFELTLIPISGHHMSTQLKILNVYLPRYILRFLCKCKPMKLFLGVALDVKIGPGVPPGPQRSVQMSPEKSGLRVDLRQ